MYKRIFYVKKKHLESCNTQFLRCTKKLIINFPLEELFLYKFLITHITEKNPKHDKII